MVEVVRNQLNNAKFDDGLEGVLQLAESTDLTSTLLAADLDVSSPPARDAVAATIRSTLSPGEMLV